MSTSSIDGYFLGKGNEAYLAPDLSDELLKTLQATCASGGPIWMLDREEPVRCTGIKYLEEAGDGPVYQVTMPAPEGDHRTSLFSIRPFSSHRWVTRTPTAKERAALLALISKVPEYTEAMKTAASKDIAAIDSLTGAWTVFIVPWTTQIDEEFGTTNDKFVVVSGVDDHYKIAGELVGSCGSFADIDGDGVPEIRVSESCDGICEYVMSLYPTVKVMVSIAVH